MTTRPAWADKPVDWHQLAVALAAILGIPDPGVTEPDQLTRLGLRPASPIVRTLYAQLASEAGHRMWPSGECARCGTHCALRTVVLTKLVDQLAVLRDLGLLNRDVVRELLTAPPPDAARRSTRAPPSARSSTPPPTPTPR